MRLRPAYVPASILHTNFVFVKAAGRYTIAIVIVRKRERLFTWLIMSTKPSPSVIGIGTKVILLDVDY